MKHFKILTASLLIICLPLFKCLGQEKDSGLIEIWISKEKFDDVPAIVYSDYRNFVLIAIYNGKDRLVFKYTNKENLVERGYGFYSDFKTISNDETINFRCLDVYDEKYQVIMTLSDKTGKKERIYDMKKIF